MNRRLTRGSAAFLGVLVAIALPALSHATASGRNGQVAFIRRVHTVSQVFTVRPDGTRLRQITHGLPAESTGSHGLRTAVACSTPWAESTAPTGSSSRSQTAVALPSSAQPARAPA